VSHMSSRGPFPRGVLLGAFGLIVFTIVGAGVARWTGIGAAGDMREFAVLDQQAIYFEDRSDGAVIVRSEESGDLVGVLDPGTNGFIRSVVRGLVRERRARDIGAEPPFYLTRWQDGRFSLDDPSTGRTVELGAFGPTNAGAFAGLLASRGVTP
jgi:putative photosynthetic complex assembly protein